MKILNHFCNMLFGEVVRFLQKKGYTKLVLGVETGYNVDIYTTRTRKSIPAFGTGQMVTFSGHDADATHNNKSYFILDEIKIYEFRQCVICLAPQFSNKCNVKHSKEPKHLKGVWSVVYKIERTGGIKVYFDQDNFVFAAVALPDHFYFKLFKSFMKESVVELEGWRYNQKTSIKNISKLL